MEQKTTDTASAPANPQKQPDWSRIDPEHISLTDLFQPEIANCLPQLFAVLGSKLR